MRIANATPARFAAATFLAGALALTLSACAGTRPAASGGSDSPDVVAAWEGVRLTLPEYERAYVQSIGNWDTAVADSAGAYVDFLERYVNFRLKVNQARSLGLDRDSTLQAEVASYREQLARPYFLDQTVLDDIVRDLFRKQQEEVHAAHVLIRVGEGASPADTLVAYNRVMALRDSIVEMGVPFAEIARRHSEDPTAIRNGGDLGYFTGGRMVHQFENAAYTTPVGEVSMPVRTSFGYHILSVSDRRPRTPEIRAAHILIRVQGNTAADSAAALQTITGIRDRIVGGEEFATLARQYSDDQASGQNGGDLGFFGLGRMVPQFEGPVFQLQNEGDISPVIESQFGYHLATLTARRTLPTFEQAYPDLKRTASELPLADEREQQLGASLRAQGGDTFDSAALDRFIGRFPADSLVFLMRRDGAGTDSLTTFASVAGEPVTLGAFVEHVRSSGTRGGFQPVHVRAEAERYLNTRAIDAAVDGLPERDPQFRAMLSQYEDGVLLFKISEDSVWARAGADEAGLRAHFAAHAAEYAYPERRRVLAFGTPSDSLLNMVRADLAAGIAPAAILETYRESPLTLRLDTVYVADSTASPLDLTIGMQPGEFTEVMPERSRLAVYLLDGIEAPRNKTFDEARAEVVSDYQEVLEAEWVARLRAQYRAHTYPERLVGAFRGPRPAWALPPSLDEPTPGGGQ